MRLPVASLQPLADGLGHHVGVTGEELDTGVVGLIAAQQAVLRIIAAAVDGSGQQIVQTQHHTGRRRLFSRRLLRCAGVDIAADDGIGVVQHRLHPVGEYDLRLEPRHPR